MEAELACLLVGHLDRLIHDVKSPINAVSGRLFLALRKTTDPGVIKNILLADLGMKNLFRRFYNLYDIAAIDSGRKYLSPETLDLGTVLKDALTFWRRIAEIQNLTISAAVPEGVKIKAHKGGFERIMDNLAANVLSHAEQATMMMFMIEAVGNSIKITVRNDGVSADEGPVEIKESVYTEGVTMNGLGLASIKRIMEHWGGTFDARIGADGDSFIAVLTFASDME